MLIAAHDKVRMCNILLTTLATIKFQFFRRVTIHREKKNLSASSCTSVCPYVSTQPPPQRFASNMISEDFAKLSIKF